jgi:hypothetical protein
MLFTGDADAEAEQRFLSEGVDLHADVLKVGHHGSAYSSTPAFIAAVHPGFAIISVGRHNMFGHPAASTLETDKNGPSRSSRTAHHRFQPRCWRRASCLRAHGLRGALTHPSSVAYVVKLRHSSSATHRDGALFSYRKTANLYESASVKLLLNQCCVFSARHVSHDTTAFIDRDVVIVCGVIGNPDVFKMIRTSIEEICRQS